MSLYQVFRPKNFNEITGQKEIVKSLVNQLKTDNFVQAYLFCGPKGTGKTSTAKLFARAINCKNRKTAEVLPCNKCDSCLSILQNRSIDVEEMDGASNNGVDDVRNINTLVQFPPSFSDYKVLIIDEVQMLSKSAFNALLKTIEEPPKYMVFIFATTEAEKIPSTVLSRLQRFDFVKLKIDEIVNRLQEVCLSVGIVASKSSLELIAKHSTGSLRDALSLLGRCESLGKELNEQAIKTLLGLPEDEKLYNLLFCLIQGKQKELLEILDNIQKSVNPLCLIEDMIDFLDRAVYKKVGIENNFSFSVDEFSVQELVFLHSKMVFSIPKLKVLGEIWVGVRSIFLQILLELKQGKNHKNTLENTHNTKKNHLVYADEKKRDEVIEPNNKVIEPNNEVIEAEVTNNTIQNELYVDDFIDEDMNPFLEGELEEQIIIETNELSSTNAVTPTHIEKTHTEKSIEKKENTQAETNIDVIEGLKELERTRYDLYAVLLYTKCAISNNEVFIEISKKDSFIKDFLTKEIFALKKAFLNREVYIYLEDEEIYEVSLLVEEKQQVIDYLNNLDK